MRIFDLLMAVRGQRIPRRNCAETTTIAEELPGLEAAVLIDATEVRRWVLATFTGDTPMGSNLVVRCIPPFERTWCEWDTLSDIGRTGLLITRQETDEGWTLHFSSPAFWYPIDRPGLHAGWRIRQVPRAVLRLSTEGGFVPFGLSPEILYESPDFPSLTDRPYAETCRAYMGTVFTALLACRFCNARGVELVERQAPRHERRRAERLGQVPPTKYYTLAIRPITRKLETEGRVKEVGLERALHLCRGHFADYTQGAGLFGKYKTEVFVPEHLRGSRERGEISKDYSVKP